MKYIQVQLTEDQIDMVITALSDYAESCEDYMTPVEEREGTETIAFINRITNKLANAKN